MVGALVMRPEKMFYGAYFSHQAVIPIILLIVFVVYLFASLVLR